MAKCEGCGAEGELKACEPWFCPGVVFNFCTACEVKDKAEDTAHDAYWEEQDRASWEAQDRAYRDAEHIKNPSNPCFW